MTSRRDFMKGAAGAALLSSTSGLWGSRAMAAADLVAAAKAAGETTVVLSIGGGVWRETLKELFFDPFTKETGIEIAFAERGGYAEGIARLRAMSETQNVEWDIIGVPHDTVQSPEIANYVESLGDCSGLPNVVSEGIDGACHGNSVLWDMVGAGIAYDENAFPKDGMKGWADFWDVEKFPGRRSLPNYGSPWSVLSAALIADGVAPLSVYPLDVDRAFKKLDQLRPHIAAWWTSGDQSQQLLRTKEVVATMMWNGRAAVLRKQGFPISFVWNGAMLEANALAIIKGAPHPLAARALLNYLYSRPEAHAEFAKRMNYSLPNKHAGQVLDADIERALPTAPQNWSNIVKADVTWLAKNRQELIERWTVWVSG